MLFLTSSPPGKQSPICEMSFAMPRTNADLLNRRRDKTDNRGRELGYALGTYGGWLSRQLMARLSA